MYLRLFLNYNYNKHDNECTGVYVVCMYVYVRV